MVLVSVLAKMHGVNEVNCCPTEKAKIKSGFSQNKVKIPEYVGQSILSLLVFVLGATMKGNSNDGMCCQSWLMLISSSQYLQSKKSF